MTEMLEVVDKVEHRDYGVGEVLELGALDPRWGQSYIVAFGSVWHRRSSWCVFSYEAVLVQKGKKQ